MSSQGANLYFIVLGPDGSQIQEVPAESAVYFSNLKGFPSRPQAERYLRITEALRDQNPPSQPRTPERHNNNRYPNSSSHWEESGDNNQRNLPSILRSPSLGGSQDVLNRVVPPQQRTSPHPSGSPASTAPRAIQPIVLSEEQTTILNMVKSRCNVFFTGPAGTGKSVLLRQIIKSLRDELGLSVAMTASTGIAGVNVGGSTLHSWAGIGLGKEKTETLVRRIKRSLKILNWTSTDTLIIDEISMIDGRLFDKLEEIGRAVRGSELPFGGLQLVICGDFCQLPPVPEQSYQHKQVSTFAFQAESWDRCMGKPILLTHVFRQRDREFVDILSAMRVGKLSSEHIRKLASLSRPLNFTDGIEPCCLFATKMEVQAHNSERLDSLPGHSFTYRSMDYRGMDVYGSQLKLKDAVKLLDDEVVLERITLKVGAQVMLIQNIIQGTLVNGSLGKVVDFMTSHEALAAKIKIVENHRQQLNVNGLQDKVTAPESQPRAEATGLEFKQINEGVKFGNSDKWPLVEFAGGILLLCAPTSFTVEGFMGNEEAKRVQVPLILAWGLSMHKSQGQTMERVKVDLGRVFEKGQAYVAISRATSLEGLQIVNFNPTKIEAHPRVLAWQDEWMPQMRTATAPLTNSAGHAGPSTLVRGTRLPSPQLISRPTARPIQREPESEWEEMDTDDSISHYFDSLPN